MHLKRLNPSKHRDKIHKANWDTNLLDNLVNKYQLTLTEYLVVDTITTVTSVIYVALSLLAVCLLLSTTFFSPKTMTWVVGASILIVVLLGIGVHRQTSKEQIIRIRKRIATAPIKDIDCYIATIQKKYSHDNADSNGKYYLLLGPDTEHTIKVTVTYDIYHFATTRSQLIMFYLKNKLLFAVSLQTLGDLNGGLYTPSEMPTLKFKDYLEYYLIQFNDFRENIKSFRVKTSDRTKFVLKDLKDINSQNKKNKK